ncbi:RHS repeat domain-containing protein, partial [Flavihumibacter cheonanensis]|uniref:RHS repeat domain-containing protein n=1 Tax=Flavihumibacter cheonanensis TaxID=1442385 RepID=UPI001EF8D95F
GTLDPIYLDDLRLFPVGAEMKTYTYDKGRGITSSSDVDGRLTFYEYDALGRLIRLRDNEGNILKQFSYEYYNTGN